MELTFPCIELNFDNCQLSDQQFFQLCQQNQGYRFERSAQGELVIMPPTSAETGNRNIDLSYQLQAWNRKTQLGMAFDSSTGFILPNGANRSPDASWIPLARWESVTPDQQQRFLPMSPDFVVELLSPTDQLSRTQAKMREYIENGTVLGWLINRKTKQVEIYRQGQNLEILDAPQTLSGENVLPEFMLDLSSIW